MTPTRAFRIPAVVLERIDDARGQRTRTAFLIEALEEKLAAEDHPMVAAMRAEAERMDARPANTTDLVDPGGLAALAAAKERLGLTTAGELARRPAAPKGRPGDRTAPASNPSPFQRPLSSAEAKAGVRSL